MVKGSKDSRTEFTVSWGTLIKLFVAVVLGLAAFRLWRLAELLLLALLIAIAFGPFIQWTRRHHWPKWLGVLSVAFILLGSTAALLVLLVPTIATESTGFVEKLPNYKQQILERLPPSGSIHAFMT